MARFITYVMALAVGLVIAVALAMPSRVAAPPTDAPILSAEEAPHPGTIVEPPAPSVVSEAEDASQAMAPPVAPSSSEHQTLMLVEIASGSVTVNVNNKAVSMMDATTSFDLSPYVRPGKNTIWLKWDRPVQADIRITRATSGGPFRDAGHAFLTLAGTQAPGEQTLLFFL